MNICSYCEHQNRVGSLICENCNKLIGDFGEAKDIVKTIQFDTPDLVAEELEKPDKIVITVPKSQNETPIVLDVAKSEFVFGRTDSSNMVEIDLNPYGAVRLGVSRQHAKLYLADDDLTWMLQDLGSTNGTYLNRHRLQKDIPYILRHGDEIVLGKMMVKVFFSNDEGTFNF